MDNVYRLKLLPPARQQLKFLPARVQNEVKGILHDLRYEPWPPTAEELRDHFQGIWKIKVDGYRIFYQVRGDQVIVINIKRRTPNTYISIFE
ncbi:MAG: type II toxin-antitoxin system RelE/ParE family toxin [Caldilineaceae bacterium]